MKALIFDIIHGGEIIAERLIESGYEVYCVDVYKSAKQEIKNKVIGMGAHLSETAPAGHYDILIAPSHCPAKAFLNDGITLDRKITFHQAVGKLIDDRRFRIEVTGVKGKTTLCYILAHILDRAGKKVFLHTSRGQGPYISGKHHIEKTLSIAPTSLLTLPEGDYDVVIAEVSLGGSGKADIAVITNLLEDYGIARNTGKASASKASVLTDNINIVESSELTFWEKYGKKVIPYGGNVKLNSNPVLGEPLDLTVNYNGEYRIEFGREFLGLEYIHAIDAALTVCENMSVPAETVIDALESFGGIPGRGEIKKDGNRLIIIERNPGISHISIDSTLSTLGKMNALDRLTVILDPVNKKVCDKLDVERIRDVVSKYNVPLKILNAGEEMPKTMSDITLILIKEGYQ